MTSVLTSKVLKPEDNHKNHSYCGSYLVFLCNNFKKYYKQLITFPLLCFYIPFPFHVFSSAETEIKDNLRTAT